ncbi:MAG: OsmC family peroxiredoxin [Flavobacteriaceae bacterium]|nr:OsmC family peroxiredoxin [Flavobacteriaceae bacterium]
MATSKARAEWQGSIKEGKGNMNFTGYNGTYSFATRFENEEGTNPEELLGAAHAGCFSMYLSLLLTEQGLQPENISTLAIVQVNKDDIGPFIQSIEIECEVKCTGLTHEKLQELAAITKEKCPVSRLFAGGTATIEATAKLL